METGKFEKKYWIGISVCLVLTALGVIGQIGAFPNGNILRPIISILILAFAAYYMAFGYKTPHGDLLKYLIWACAVLTVYTNVENAQFRPFSSLFIDILAALLMTYMAGRLDRIKENRILGYLILAMKLYVAVAEIVGTAQLNPSFISFTGICAMVSSFILWLDILHAYLLRYKMHREAGFTQKKK